MRSKRCGSRGGRPWVTAFERGRFRGLGGRRRATCQGARPTGGRVVVRVTSPAAARASETRSRRLSRVVVAGVPRVTGASAAARTYARRRGGRAGGARIPPRRPAHERRPVRSNPLADVFDAPPSLQQRPREAPEAPPDLPRHVSRCPLGLLEKQSPWEHVEETKARPRRRHADARDRRV